jgi:hypothetical protein
MRVQALPQSSSNGAHDSGAALHLGARSMKAVMAFGAVAFAWSWSTGILAQYDMERSPTLGVILTMVSGFGPSIAGVAVVACWSVLTALVLHTSLNAWAAILGIVPTAATARPYMLVTALMVLIASVFMLTQDKKHAANANF